MNSKPNFTNHSCRNFNPFLAALALTLSVPGRADTPTFSDANWVSLGSGMNGTVFALAASGTNLYAAGRFTTAGGIPANNIARWDGSAWSALGSGMGGDYPYVYALAVSGTNLYAGGLFTTAGGVRANNIAKWDGRAWSALGSGMNEYGTVEALAVSGTDLYAGGELTMAGGVPASGVAKWDGHAWSALGEGVEGNRIIALTVNGANLDVGGGFNTAGGVVANGIAKWDGNAWSTLGSGMGGDISYVEALAVSGTDLYAAENLPRRVGWRPPTSPNGTAVLGQPWARGSVEVGLLSMRWP
ncbi:conserved exported hypothetical protein [Verrucomicrobia bacterium]|nr:conserved exported hypothetical protein [Verrucomicrobiota bacterium]